MELFEKNIDTAGNDYVSSTTMKTAEDGKISFKLGGNEPEDPPTAADKSITITTRYKLNEKEAPEGYARSSQEFYFDVTETYGVLGYDPAITTTTDENFDSESEELTWVPTKVIITSYNEGINPDVEGYAASISDHQTAEVDMWCGADGSGTEIISQNSFITITDETGTTGDTLYYYVNKVDGEWKVDENSSDLTDNIVFYDDIGWVFPVLTPVKVTLPAQPGDKGTPSTVVDQDSIVIKKIDDSEQKNPVSGADVKLLNENVTAAMQQNWTWTYTTSNPTEVASNEGKSSVSIPLSDIQDITAQQAGGGMGMGSTTYQNVYRIHEEAAPDSGEYELAEKDTIVVKFNGAIYWKNVAYGATDIQNLPVTQGGRPVSSRSSRKIQLQCGVRVTKLMVGKR